MYFLFQLFIKRLTAFVGTFKAMSIPTHPSPPLRNIILWQTGRGRIRYSVLTIGNTSFTVNVVIVNVGHFLNVFARLWKIRAHYHCFEHLFVLFLERETGFGRRPPWPVYHRCGSFLSLFSTSAYRLPSCPPFCFTRHFFPGCISWGLCFDLLPNKLIDFYLTVTNVTTIAVFSCPESTDGARYF